MGGGGDQMAIGVAGDGLRTVIQAVGRVGVVQRAEGVGVAHVRVVAEGGTLRNEDGGGMERGVGLVRAVLEGARGRLGAVPSWVRAHAVVVGGELGVVEQLGTHLQSLWSLGIVAVLGVVGDVEVLDVEAVVVVLVVEVVDGVGVLIGADAVVSLRVDGRTHVDRSVVVGGGPVHTAAVAEHGVGAVGAAIH